MKWVSAQYGHDWPNHFTKRKSPSVTSTIAKNMPKRSDSCIIGGFKDTFSDLSSQYTHEAITIGGEEYLLLNVPADDQCLFHLLAAVVKPLYTGVSLTYKEV